jgi:hypothetical protein
MLDFTIENWGTDPDERLTPGIGIGVSTEFTEQWEYATHPGHQRESSGEIKPTVGWLCHDSKIHGGKSPPARHTGGARAQTIRCTVEVATEENPTAKDNETTYRVNFVTDRAGVGHTFLVVPSDQRPCPVVALSTPGEKVLVSIEQSVQEPPWHQPRPARATAAEVAVVQNQTSMSDLLRLHKGVTGDDGYSEWAKATNGDQVRARKATARYEKLQAWTLDELEAEAREPVWGDELIPEKWLKAEHPSGQPRKETLIYLILGGRHGGRREDLLGGV